MPATGLFAPTEEDAVKRILLSGQDEVYVMVGLVVQTFVFGIYTFLIWMSTRMLLQRKLNTRVNKVMFGITTFMYTISAAYWMYSIANGVDKMQQVIDLALHPFKETFDHTAVTKWSPLFNAIMLINYVLSDGVVVWRAWIICLRNHRKYLWITMGFLAMTAITVLLTIIFRIVGQAVSPIDSLRQGTALKSGIDILQVITLGTSLLSNFTATGVVGVTAWRHYRTTAAVFSKEKTSSLRTNHILLLVVETGVLYCISAVIVVLSSVIRVPIGTLGDLYTPINVQFAGAYPCVVLLLVSSKKSLSESSFSDASYDSSSSTISAPIKFGKMDFSSSDSTIRPPHRPKMPPPMHFARNPNWTATDTFMSLDPDADTSMPKSSIEKNRRLSDESFV